jgi:hypothetical protein
MEELYTALNSNLLTLSTIGIRTVFDKASSFLSVDSTLCFEEKIDDLERKGKIGKEEKRHLSILIPIPSIKGI